MMFWNSNWPVWQVVLMWVGMAAFAGLAIWFVFGFGTTASSGSLPDVGDGAQRILDERLARSEIDTDEYRRLRSTMASGTSHHADTVRRQ